MPAENLHVPEFVKKRVHKFPQQVQRRIAVALIELKSNPLLGVKLGGKLSNYYKIRIGDYRIVYIFYPKLRLIEILKIEHRQGVYR